MSGIAALNYQAIKNSGLPVGAQVMMPYTTVPSFTAPSGEVFVKNSIASVIPASQCHPSLIPALTAENDVTFSVTNKIDLNLFGNGVTGIPSVLSGVKSATGSSGSVEYQQTPTIGLYVDSMYYFFLRNGYVTTTDLQYFSQKKTIPQLVALNIVDVKYIAGTWYFIDSSGYIASMTDLSGSNLAINQTVMMPASASSYGYIGSAYINGALYIYGSSKANPSAGYSVIKSTDFANWSVVVEVTSGAAPITSLCQGSGAGAATEIFGCCASTDVVVKSVNNGTSFTQTAAFSGLVGIKSVLYSGRTGKYYAVAIATGGYLYILTSSTSTLTTATFSSLSTTSQSDAVYSANATTLIDNGSNIGFISAYQNSPYFTYINGGSYATTSLSLDATTGLSQNSTYISAYPISVNGNIVIITSPSNYSGATNSSAKMMLLVSGATLSTSSKLLWFPVVSSTSYMTPPAVLGGVNYSIIGGQSANASAYHLLNLYKFNAGLSAVALALQTTQYLSQIGQNCISSPSLSSPGIITWSISTTNQGNGVYAIKFDGSALSSAYLQGSMYQLPTDPTDLVMTPFAMKWSSMFSAYLYGGVTNSSSANLSILSASTIGGAATTVYSLYGNSYQASVTLFDVLSGGHGIVVANQNNGSGLIINYLSVVTPSGSYTIQSTSQSSIMVCSVYDISGTDGNKYIGVISQTTSPAQATLNVYRLSANSAPVLVMSANVTGLLTVTGIKLRRVVQSGNNFYLTDTTPGTVNKNSALITQYGSSFTFKGAAYCNLPADNAPSGTSGISGSLNSATIYSTAAIPAVYLPPGTAGSYIKVK